MYDTLDIVHVLHMVFKNCFYFVAYARKEIVTISDSSTENMTKPFKIIKSSGKIFKEFYNENELQGGKSDSYEHRWLLELNRKMALKFTFVDLYFSSSSQDCFRANLSLTNGEKSQAFHFCGQHSTFPLYPAFKQLNMILFANHRAYFYIWLTFSLIDSQIIASSNYNTSDSTFISSLILSPIKSEKNVISYYF